MHSQQSGVAGTPPHSKPPHPLPALLRKKDERKERKKIKKRRRRFARLDFFTIGENGWKPHKSGLIKRRRRTRREGKCRAGWKEGGLQVVLFPAQILSQRLKGRRWHQVDWFCRSVKSGLENQYVPLAHGTHLLGGQNGSHSWHYKGAALLWCGAGWPLHLFLSLGGTGRGIFVCLFGQVPPKNPCNRWRYYYYYF